MSDLLAQAIQELGRKQEQIAKREEQREKTADRKYREKGNALLDKIKKETNENKKSQLREELRDLARSKVQKKRDVAQTRLEKDSISVSKKNLIKSEAGLGLLRKRIEENGGKAEQNLDFLKAQNKVRQEALKVQKESAPTPSARKEIAKEQRKARFEAFKLALTPQNRILGGLLSTFKGLAGAKTGVPGLSLGKLALLTAIPFIVKFLRSEKFQEIVRYIQEVALPAVTKLYNNVIVPIGRFLKDQFFKAWENIKLLFTDIGDAIKQFQEGDILGGIKTLIKGLFGFVDRTLTNIFNTISGFFGGPQIEEGQTLFGVIKDFFNNLIKKTIKIAEDTFSAVINFPKNAFLKIQESFGQFFTDLKEKFTPSEAFKKRIGEVFEPIINFPQKIRDTLNEIDIFGPVRKGLNELPDKLKDILPDFSKIGENLKVKFNESLEKIMDKIPVPDFSGIGEKFAEIGRILSPSRILRSIGDSIKNTDFGVLGAPLKFALLKVFPTSEESTGEQVPVDTFVNEVKGKPMHSGGFLARGQLAMVGERGPEFIMSDSPAQVMSEARTDQLGMAAVNKIMNGGGGMGGNVFVNTGGNTATNVTRNVSFRPSAHIDTNFDKYQKFA